VTIYRDNVFAPTINGDHSPVPLLIVGIHAVIVPGLPQVRR